MPVATRARRLVTLGPLWHPGKVANLLGWYRADKQAGADASTITSFLDQSGQKNNLAQWTGTGVTLKLAIQNGYPAARFVASSMRATFTLGQPSTVFLVCPSITWVNNTAVCDGATGATMQLQAQGTSGQYRLSTGSGQTAGTAAAPPLVFECAYDTTAASFAAANGTAFSAGALGAATPAGFTLGGAGGGGVTINMDCSEALVYSRFLSRSERVAIRKYLGKKYLINVVQT